MNRAVLLLEDGTFFEGRSFAAKGEAVGEIVFNTSMTGYQEIISDPSYRGQIVTMTYPHIGNYGINPEDFESERIFAEGLIVREYCREPSNWRATRPLHEFMIERGIPGIEGIDTRALTLRLREVGVMQGILSAAEFDRDRLATKLAAAPRLVGRDLVREVTCRERHHFGEGEGYHVAVYDFGVKKNILKSLAEAGCRVTIIPAETSVEDLLALEPDGVVLSNGPGDPAALGYAIDNSRKLIAKRPDLPIFGICLGHQILGLALGGETFKLKFGHHGANHPVKELSTGRVVITTQNHGFAVDPARIAARVEVTHINLNDQTVEGMRYRDYPVFSVQYHPEASPGPHDAHHLFSDFIGGLG